MGMTGGKGGGKNALAAKPNLLNALRVQTSSYGQVIPILYGQNRLSGRLIWAGDFTAVPHTSTQKTGGKGLGSGSGQVTTQTTYTYQTAVAIALCMGPVQSIGSVWDTKGKLTLLSTQVITSVPSGPPFDITPAIPGGGRFHLPRGVSRADNYSLSANDFGSDGSTTISGQQQSPLTQVTGTPGPGQYTIDPVTGKHSFNAADAGKTVTINYTYFIPDTSSATGAPPLNKLSLTLTTGVRPQSPWSYLVGAHSAQALGYNGIAYLSNAAMDLGTSGSLPNLSYDVLGPLSFGGGILDAEPSTILSDLITNPFYGMSGVITVDSNTLNNNNSSYRNFCIANGLFLSPVLDAQKTAADWIKSILDVTNAAAVWSEGVLKIVSYGDTTVVGNGATFIPNTTPIYDITTNDLLSEVLVQRPSVADVMNSVSVEYVNRANDYNVDVAEDKDEAAIALYGLRKAQPVQAHAITTAGVAKYAANLIRKRMIEIRATYTLTLGWQFNLLEPMDLVTITVPELGYNKKPVRITAIREDDSGQLEVDCEDFPWGTATATAYTQQAPVAFAPNTNADPGNVNPPVVFEAPFNLSRSGDHEIWIAVSGSSPSWGGCHVWVSLDNTEYKQIGTITAAARMGVLGGGGTFSVTGDPYTGPVGQTFDLTESGGLLLAGTQADADSYRTLMYLGGEFISYSSLEPISANVYRPAVTGGGSTYIRRGLLGSTIVAHAQGEPVVRLDDAIFAWAYDPTFIGKTVSLKFTSINSAGAVEQSLTTAAQYLFFITGRYCQMESAGKNLISNPSFENNQAAIPIGSIVPAGGRIMDGWKSSGTFTAAQFNRSIETFGPHSGSHNVVISLATGQSIPTGGTGTNAAVETDMIPISPGESYAFGGWIRVDANATFPANVGCIICIGLAIYGADGTFLTHISPLSAIGTHSGFFLLTGVFASKPYQKCDSYVTIAPTYNGVVPAMMSVFFINLITNTTGAAFNTGGSLFCDARADDLYCVPQWAMTGNEVGNTGNRSVTYAGTMSYTSTSSSITWTWTNLSALRTDLAMSSNSYTGSQAITGLTASTSYNFYPFIDEIFSQVNMVATGGTGTPSWAHVGVSAAWTQEMTRADHFPLSTTPFAASTAATGGSGGGSTPPPDGACLRHDVKVRERSRGLIPVSVLEAGDWVSCPIHGDTPDGWVQVEEIQKGYTSSQWVHSHFNNADWIATTTRHPFTLADGSERDAFSLTFEDQVPCLTGIAFMTRHSLEEYVALKVDIKVASKAHVFFAGMVDATICQHNINRISIS